MSRLRTFGAFCYDFVIGDDWRIAVGVLAGLAATSLLVHVAHVGAWWLLPFVVVTGLAASLWLATRPRPTATAAASPTAGSNDP